jgi:hypothetical protein
MIDTYFDLWNETDAARRDELVRTVFTADGRHVDPLADVRGHAELAAMIAGVQSHYPGHRLVRTSEVDAHHDTLRYTWRLAGPDGTVVVEATDVVELAPDGRFASVAAFFGEPAPLSLR